MDDELEARVQGATAVLDDRLRRLGLYVDETQVIEGPDGRAVLYCEVLVGDVAFQKRVQDPEQASVDHEFRKLARSQNADDFLATRDDMARRLAEGRPLFGDKS